MARPKKTHCLNGHDMSSTRVDRRGNRFCYECKKFRAKLYWAASPELRLRAKVRRYYRLEAREEHSKIIQGKSL